MSIKAGVCVRLPDKRIGRVRDKNKYGEWRVRVKRTTSNSHQFLYFTSKQLKVIVCPKGWMSVDGYNSYLKQTISKMKQRKSLDEK
jgi:hypothetical protein